MAKRMKKSLSFVLDDAVQYSIDHPDTLCYVLDGFGRRTAKGPITEEWKAKKILASGRRYLYATVINGNITTGAEVKL